MMLRKMKVSGVEAIDCIPIAWRVLRLKDVLRQATTLKKSDAKKYVGLEQIAGWRGTAVPIDMGDAGTESAQLIRKGAICFSKLRPYLAKALVAETDLVVTSELLVARPLLLVNPAYLLYWLLSHRFICAINDRVAGTKMPRVDWSTFAGMPTPLPNLEEQRRIADWLDLQTTRIDKRRELLAKKRELLHELRKSLVHEKVCQRVNQNGETVRIKEVVKINPSTRLPRFGSVEFYPMDAIGVDGGLTAGQFKDVSGATGYSQFKNGDVLFAKVTPCFENGKSAIAERVTTPAALATTEVIVLRPNKKISPQFLHYRLKARDFADMGESEMKGAGGLKRVPEKHVANFCFGLPNKSEQQVIVDFLDHKHSQIDRQITLIDQLDNLLKEQRKAIIHEAVTGKIDLSSAPLGLANVD